MQRMLHSHVRKVTTSETSQAGLHRGSGRLWSLLALQLPGSPSAARVKTWRRLRQLGALALRNAVYVLPHSAQSIEDFAWLRTEIEAMGGQAMAFTATAVDDRDDAEIVHQFQTARRAQFTKLVKEIDRFAKVAQSRRGTGHVKKLRWLHERLNHERSIDFFGGADSESLEAKLAAIERQLRPNRDTPNAAATTRSIDRASYTGRTWLTRPRPGVDRFASAWLIRRFIDPQAEFAFADRADAIPQAVPFDMYEGGFGHEGDRCTFEVLVLHFEIRDRAVQHLAHIVHDLDLKDERFRPPHASTVEALVEGLRASINDDQDLMRQGIATFEALYRGIERQTPKKVPSKGRPKR